jgi:hypothetical protein
MKRNETSREKISRKGLPLYVYSFSTFGCLKPSQVSSFDLVGFPRLTW